MFQLKSNLFELDCSLKHSGGPIAIICLIFCFTPYFFKKIEWEDALDDDPIKFSLQSLSYRYATVAGIAASIPSLLDLIFHIVMLRAESNGKYYSVLAILLSLVIPELVSICFISPNSNTKLYLCIYCAQSLVALYATTYFLCEYGGKFWRNKYFTIALCLVYFGTALPPSIPFFSPHLRDWILYVSIFIRIIGFSYIVILSCKYLSRNCNCLKDYTNETDVGDDLFCRYAICCLLFIIFGFILVYFALGSKYWTQNSPIFLICVTFLMTAPSLTLCTILTQATRSQSYFTQSIKVMYVRYISHEMRTPLNTAMMGLQYLRKELLKYQVEEELVNVLDEINSACEISVMILNEMLDYDKLQSGLMKLELEDLHVKDFLNTLISPFNIHAQQKDILLTYNFEKVELTSLYISADRNKFSQVIRNIISNALKFTPERGSICIDARVSEGKLLSPVIANGTTSTTTMTSTNYNLHISVTDTGAGVSKENQKLLFKEIIQFNPAKLQSGGGSGLGLYISKSIIDLHHGSLFIESEGEGQGCTFTTTLRAFYKIPSINDYIPDVLSSDEDDDSDAAGNLSTHSSRLTSIGRSSLHEKGSYRISWNQEKKVMPCNRGTSRDSLLVSSLPTVPIGCSSSATSQDPIDISLFTSSPTTSTATAMSLLKVLVVDDSSCNRKMLVRLLRDRCSTIVEAVDGVEAVNLIRDVMDTNTNTNTQRIVKIVGKPYDAVLMDYVMPNMEGPEAARCIRELGYTGLIIGITGNVLPSDKEKFIAHGANIVLSKPVNIKDIDKAFRSILALR